MNTYFGILRKITENSQILVGSILRAVILAYFLGLVSSVLPRAPLDPQQIVQTNKPMVCVHTRLIDEVYEWKIQRSLQLVREMGATTIVEFFPWAYAEPTKGHYDWASFDRIARHAHNQGLHIIARMGLVPEWARNEEGKQSTLNYLPDDSFQYFADFVSVFAQRYAGTIDQIIIWNEPNLAFEWGYRPVLAPDYARLLETVYRPAHEANPNVMILAAPLAPTLEPRSSPNGLDDLLYLEDLYKAGAAPYFDALAMHTYGFTEPPEANPSPNDLNFRRAELLHTIMMKYDNLQKPVFITESGWNDNPRWTKAVRPSARVIYTVDAFKWAENHWPWLDKLCLWVLRYPASTQSYPDNFALITPDFELTPIYYAIQSYARGKQQESSLWLPDPAQ